MATEAQAREKIKWMSRDARRFMGAEPPFYASLEYESDVDGLVTAHPSWVSGDEDLTDLGRAVRAVLVAEPDLIHAA